MRCSTIDVPDMAEGALVCMPNAPSGERWPLFVWGHGDGNTAEQYFGMIQDLAGFGFVVAAYRSCRWSATGVWGSECDMGRSAFLEVLKLIAFLEKADPVTAPVDMSQKITVGGHSGGGRAALMVAAVRDSPTYLSGTVYAELLEYSGGFLREAASRVGAVVGLHADWMFNNNSNPDVEGFRHAISHTPVLLGTSVDDFVVPPAQTWSNFLHVRSPVKIYINMNEGYDGHREPILYGYEAPWVAMFAQAFAGRNHTARGLLYGDCEACLRHSALFAHQQEQEGDVHNRSDVAVMLCGSSAATGMSIAWPPEDATACEAMPPT